MAKSEIRKSTDNFILKSAGSVSYSPVIESAESQSLNNAVINNSNLANINFINSPELFGTSEVDSALTGAAEPMLPMRVSMTGTDGSRIELVMLISPETMNHGKTQSVQTSYTRGGYVVQPWGYNMDILTSTGRTAAFMVSGMGMTNELRSYSFGYSNFMSLMNAYKNNGYQILDPTQTSKEVRIINLISGIEIFYDNNTMLGHFNNFTFDEAADQPFIFNYNFEFVVCSLDGNYSEIRGHFFPIPQRLSAGSPKPIILLSDIPYQMDNELV